MLRKSKSSTQARRASPEPEQEKKLSVVPFSEPKADFKTNERGHGFLSKVSRCTEEQTLSGHADSLAGTSTVALAACQGKKEKVSK